MSSPDDRPEITKQLIRLSSDWEGNYDDLVNGSGKKFEEIFPGLRVARPKLIVILGHWRDLINADIIRKGVVKETTNVDWAFRMTEVEKVMKQTGERRTTYKAVTGGELNNIIGNFHHPDRDAIVRARALAIPNRGNIKAGWPNREQIKVVLEEEQIKLPGRYSVEFLALNGTEAPVLAEVDPDGAKAIEVVEALYRVAPRKRDLFNELYHLIAGRSADWCTLVAEKNAQAAVMDELRKENRKLRLGSRRGEMQPPDAAAA